MNYTKEQIKQIVIKILNDLGNDYYFEDKIYIEYEENLKPLWGNVIKKAWSIGIGIPDFQFQHQSGDVIGIDIDDETGEIINYIEGPGRPVPTTVKLNDEGKYVFTNVPNFDFDKYMGN
jgi:hypothetical protein